ncbi:DUF3226 domain-containing protein [Brachyspira pilosicoli]|uniref:DUF3226 domain-containing protein n=1 Tax=Brachyspira pilosicoli TaxID=52584 RepID=UPI001CA4FC89|nr:DUF3226 domain-containing protein [Brachyspira pilosicoli]MBW5397136.1 hypothetical protein [Brachyspira pilosicoli]
MRIIVEGDSDKKFLESYLKYLNIRNYTKIVSIGGKDNIVNHKELKKEDFIIIFDADDDYNESKINIENQLNKLDIKNNKIFLFPNNKDIGNLETLIEKIAIYKEVLQCYENYESCIDYLINQTPNLKHQAKKSKVFAYMSGFGFKNNIKAEDFDLTPYVDFDNIYLNDLKNFLENIF